jgi:hypothetical protein
VADALALTGMSRVVGEPNTYRRQLIGELHAAGEEI